MLETNYINGFLQDNEQIIWTGAPSRMPSRRDSGAPPLMFGIFFIGFATIWTIMAFVMTKQTGAPQFVSIVMPLVGLLFILIGVTIFIAPMLANKKRMKSLTYVVTDKRLMIFEGKGFKSKNIAQLQNIDFSVDANGFATLKFTFSGGDIANGDVVGFGFGGVNGARTFVNGRQLQPSIFNMFAFVNIIEGQQLYQTIMDIKDGKTIHF